MRFLDAAIILTGLDQPVSREKMFDGDRLAIVGHRAADLFVSHRAWQCWQLRMLFVNDDNTLIESKTLSELFKRQACA